MAILFAANIFAGYALGSTYNTSLTNGCRGESPFSQSVSNQFAASSIRPSSGAAGALEIKLPATETEFWAAVQYYIGSGTPSSTAIMEFGVFGGNKSLGIHMVNGDLRLRYWDGAAWNTLTVVPTKNNFNLYGIYSDDDINHRFDVHVNLHATTGFVRVYNHGLLVWSYSGNTIFNSVSAVDNVRMCGDLTAMTISESIVAGEKTIGLRAATVTVNAAGATSSWTGAYTTVDEESGVLATNDADFLESSTNDQITTVGLDVLGVPGMPIRGVVANARALTTGAAPTKVNTVVRTGGVDYHGTDKTIGAAFEGVNDVWELNPGTGLAWTSADITALEIGVRSRA